MHPICVLCFYCVLTQRKSSKDFNCFHKISDTANKGCHSYGMYWVGQTRQKYPSMYNSLLQLKLDVHALFQ